VNFVELKAELSERGFSHLSQQRLGQYVNRARARLDAMYRWPYLLTGTASIATIADLGQVDSVYNTTGGYTLDEATFEELQNDYSDTLTATGSPSYWYRTSAGVGTYPITTDSIMVTYWKRSPVLTETDTPLAPSDYHMLYVDIAQAMAYRDSDNHQAAEALQVDIDRQVAEMATSLLAQSERQYMRITFASEDW
jgi:hypothetical protein